MIIKVSSVNAKAAIKLCYGAYVVRELDVYNKFKNNISSVKILSNIFQAILDKDIT